MQERLHWAGTRQMEEDAVLILFDLCRNFEEGQNERRGLRLGQGRVLQRLRAQRMMEGLGRAREYQPHRVSEARRRRGSITAEVHLHGLDGIFAGASGAIEVFIEHGWGRSV